MMNRLLNYVLCMLFIISTANAIWCFQCYRSLHTMKCVQQNDFCWAGQNASCFILKTYVSSLNDPSRTPSVLKEQPQMMNTFPIYGAWMVFHLYSANAIWCFHCLRPLPKGNCSPENEFCWAGEEAGCYTLKLYLSKTLISSEAGCMQECHSYRTYSRKIWHEVICCFTDYCNP